MSRARGGAACCVPACEIKPAGSIWVADAALDIRYRLRHKQYSCGCGELTPLRLHLTRGDLGQLAPRKKLLKSVSSFPDDFLRHYEHFGAEGFSFLPSLLP